MKHARSGNSFIPRLVEFSDSTHPAQFNPSVLMAASVMISPFYLTCEQRLILYSYL